MAFSLSAWGAVIHFLFLIAPLQSQSSDLTYSDLVTLKVTCGDLDNCHGNKLSEDLRVVNCQCGSGCARLGTCCVDSEYRRGSPSSLEVPVQVYGSNETVFMVTECRGGVVDEGVRELCEIEDYEAYTDPFLLVPVSDTRTGLVYRNYYCFVCNEKDNSPGSPLLWGLKLFVESNGEAIPSVKSFPDLRYQWGQFLFQDQFAHITVDAPKEVYSQLNWFREDVIRTCAQDWADVTTEEKCGAYMAMVYIRDEFQVERFQNPHCAICNYRNVSDLICSEPGGYRSWEGPLDGFQLVGSFSLEDTDKRCPNNEVFDKFAQTCRVLRCKANKILVDGECVNNPVNGESNDTSVWLENTISPGNPVPKDVFTWVSTSSTEKELPELPGTPLPTKSPVNTRNPLSDQTDDFQWTSATNTSSGGDLITFPEMPLTTELPIVNPNVVSDHPDYVRFETDPNPFTRGYDPELPSTPLPTEKPQSDKPIGFQPTPKPNTLTDRGKPGPTSSIGKDRPQWSKTPAPTQSPISTGNPQWFKPDDYQWTWDYDTSVTKKPSELPKTPLPAIRPTIIRNPSYDGVKGGPVSSTGRFHPRPPQPDLRLDIHTFNQTTRPKGFVLFVFYDK